jgi:transcriptional regulator with XRE-family HTH domain
MLAGKLLEIRTKLALSQNGMIRRMGLADEIIQADISAFELDQREPPLAVLLSYARAANVLVEVLIDDKLSLPDKLPCRTRHEGIRRPAAKKCNS